ncbi:MAG: isochorismatase family protein [Pseudomonadota bacterium]
MVDWKEETLASYKSKGFASRSGYGARPGLLIVDFINGFTDPTSPLGGNFDSQLDATNALLSAFRAKSLPIAYTVVEYEHDYSDAGVFIEKVPSLSVLKKGSHMVKVDDRIAPVAGENIVSKRFASSFFGTDLDAWYRENGVDTCVIVGCTTSGCVRASAVDSLQYGYRTVVVRDGCGDRAEGPHEANLFDIDAKYGDVISLDDCLAYVNGLGAEAAAG